jgi:hypothetical protein
MNTSMNMQPTSCGTRPQSGVLMPLSEAIAAIQSGRALSIAADESLLRQLPKGLWIGGSIPYFMGQGGGEATREKLFVSELPALGATPTLAWYGEERLPHVAQEAPDHGLSVLIIPAFSSVHSIYARQAPAYEEMYMKPLVGWIAGVHLDDLDRAQPVVVNGQTLEFSTERALAMHIPLPDAIYPRIDILNLFTPGTGDTIRFPSTGFSVSECWVNERLVNFAQYLSDNAIDTRQPLVADYSGAMVNVSFKTVDLASGQVDFYAPVFDDAQYRLAAPVTDFRDAWAHALPPGAPSPAWSCNCILNFLYSELEGQRTGAVTGPMTFGEIAYQLLNQTMVCVTLDTV